MRALPTFSGTYAACGFQIQLVRKRMQYMIQVSRRLLSKRGGKMTGKVGGPMRANFLAVNMGRKL